MFLAAGRRGDGQRIDIIVSEAAQKIASGIFRLMFRIRAGSKGTALAEVRSAHPSMLVHRVFRVNPLCRRLGVPRGSRGEKGSQHNPRDIDSV